MLTSLSSKGDRDREREPRAWGSPSLERWESPVFLGFLYWLRVTAATSLRDQCEKNALFSSTLGDFSLGLVAFGPVVGSTSCLAFMAEETASCMEAGSKERKAAGVWNSVWKWDCWFLRASTSTFQRLHTWKASLRNSGRLLRIKLTQVCNRCRVEPSRWTALWFKREFGESLRPAWTTEKILDQIPNKRESKNEVVTETVYSSQRW